MGAALTPDWMTVSLSFSRGGPSESLTQVRADASASEGIAGPLASDKPADGTTVADQQAWTDAAVCSLTADLQPPVLDWACSMWTDRARHSAW